MVRLVTLTGPGGVGKTRLALEAGRRLVSRFADGVGFVSLAPSESGLVPLIAAALGVPRVSAEPPTAAETAKLLDRPALLILDNFESVIDHAMQAGDLLVAAPRLRLLVTSRVALRLSGEHDVPVEPLSLPRRDGRLSAALESEAVQSSRSLEALDADIGNIQLLADARPRLGEAGYADAWDEGCDLTFEAGVAVATAALQAVVRTARS